MRRAAWCVAVACGLVLSGCSDVEETGDEARDRLAAKIEAELVDFLECDGGVRPSTIARLQQIIKDPKQLKLKDLVVAPEDVAGLVGMAGLSVEGYVLLAQNFLLLFEQGHVKSLIEQGRDGLMCDDVLTLACTAGTGTTKVLCPQGGTRTIESSYSGCVLRGRKHEGKMWIAVPAADQTSAQVTFGGLVLDEVTAITGDIALDLDATKTSQTLTLGEASELQIVSHGGPSGGRSCGEQLTVSRLELGNTPMEAKIGVKGDKRTVDATYALETFGPSQLSWAKPFACACPGVGSGLQVSVPRPLGRADQTATMRVTYGAGAAGSCATARVELVDWPTDCSFLENPTSDCGKSAARDVIEPLLTAMCQPLEQE